MTSARMPHSLQLNAARVQSGPAREKESAARTALEERAGRTLSDLEWDRARARLLEFAALLRAWHRKGTSSECELGKAA